MACVLDVAAHVMAEIPKRVADQHPVLNKATKLTANMPICAVPAAKNARPAASGAAESFQRTALRMKIDALMPAYERSIDLVGKIRVRMALESDPKRTLSLEHDLEQAESAIAEYDGKLAKLYAQLEATP
jgi:hypothetical protein